MKTACFAATAVAFGAALTATTASAAPMDPFEVEVLEDFESYGAGGSKPMIWDHLGFRYNLINLQSSGECATNDTQGNSICTTDVTDGNGYGTVITRPGYDEDGNIDSSPNNDEKPPAPRDGIGNVADEFFDLNGLYFTFQGNGSKPDDGSVNYITIFGSDRDLPTPATVTRTLQIGKNYSDKFLADGVTSNPDYDPNLRITYALQEGEDNGSTPPSDIGTVAGPLVKARGFYVEFLNGLYDDVNFINITAAGTATSRIDDIRMGYLCDPAVEDCGGTQIPLPAAAWLLLGGLGALGVAARRRKDGVMV